MHHWMGFEPIVYYFLIADCIVVYRSLGQEVFCSVREADYEIASYARQHGCMGILGQDSDFIIYDRFVKIIMFLYFGTSEIFNYSCRKLALHYPLVS